MKRFLTVFGAIFCAASAMQAQPGNVLVWSVCNNSSSTSAIATWLQASGQFSSVTGNDSGSATLPLSTLLNYSQVLFFTNSSCGENPVAIGNVLDGYAATGRRLVVTTFAWASQGGNTVGGAFVTNGDSPFVLKGTSLYSNATMKTNNGSAFFNGVNTVTGYYRDSVTLASGATLLATWSDGDVMEAIKGNVVGVSLFPVDSIGNISGDYRQLFVNSLVAANNITLTPLPPTWLLACLGIVCIALYTATKKRAFR